jgi:hypothetical protein
VSQESSPVTTGITTFPRGAPKSCAWPGRVARQNVGPIARAFWAPAEGASADVKVHGNANSCGLIGVAPDVVMYAR